MNLRIERAEGTATAYVDIVDAAADPSVAELTVSDDVQAFVGDHGLVAIEVSDTTRWGDPFDTDAARRAIEWTTAQLGMPAA